MRLCACMGLCVCVCVWVRGCVRACVHVCVCMCNACCPRGSKYVRVFMCSNSLRTRDEVMMY